MDRKVSILMPTYNDGATIEKSINSVINQTYRNWELIVVDDGSTDNTREILSKISKKDERVKYIYQENGDQLNAVLNGSAYVTGDYVTIFHSDDLLPSDKHYENCVTEMEKDLSYDGIIGDLIQINENDEVIKTIHVSEYKIEDNIIPKTLMVLGGNLYLDIFFAKTEVFKKYILENYVKWNMPFWIYYTSKGPKQLKLKKANFPMLQYRIFSENYINSELGKLNVVNGMLRTAVSLMKYYNIPAYKRQFFVYKIYNKLRAVEKYSPSVEIGEFKNKRELIRNILRYNVGDDFKKYKYLNSVMEFYKNFDNGITIKYFTPISEEEIYMGKDMRIFNKKILDGTLPGLYDYLLERMTHGFRKVIVSNNEEKEKMETVLKFLNVAPFVEVVAENNN